jgi:hypothetical protein
MATLYITEFSSTILMHGRGGTAGQYPAIAEQTISIGGASTQASPFNSNTTIIRVHTDAICSIEIGVSPTATTSKARLAANQTEYFGVSGGHIIAVISNT